LIFGVGTDIVEIRRVEKQLSSTGGIREILFTSREIAYCESKRRSASHFAARFAAKEAFMKALGTGWNKGFRFDEIEIVNDGMGKPVVQVHGKVKAFCGERSINRIHVSLSHSHNLAKAIVLLEGIPSDRP
jgi:holo-[acyl-carrier protein] synthase